MTEQIRVHVRVLAGFRDALGGGDIEMRVGSGTSVAGLVDQIAAMYPKAGLRGRRLSYTVNRQFVSLEYVLADGDEMALFAPAFGGAR